MRNALALPGYAFPDSANLDVRGISNALSEYTQGVRQDRRDSFDRDMRTKQFGLQEQANNRASQSHDMEMQKAKVGQIAGIAAAALNEKDPARQAQMMQQAYALHPGIADHLTKAGVNPGDHVGTAKFLLAEARGFGVYNPLDDEAKRASIAQTRASAAAANATLQQVQKQTPEYRARIAPKFNLQPGTPEYNQFVLNGTYAPKGDIHLKDGEEIWRPSVGPDGKPVVGPDGQPSYARVAGNAKDKTPPGYRPTQDGNMEAVPGGPADIKQSEKRQQDYATLQATTQQLDEFAASANRVLKAPGLDKNFGVQGYIPNMPGGDAANAKALLDTLKTQGAFAVLQQMRNASKTGGALGSVTEGEHRMLERALASLERSQSVAQVKENLGIILQHIERSKERIRTAYNDHWNKGERQSQASAPAVGSIVEDNGARWRFKGGNPAVQGNWELAQ